MTAPKTITLNITLEPEQVQDLIEIIHDEEMRNVLLADPSMSRHYSDRMHHAARASKVFAIRTAIEGLNKSKVDAASAQSES